MNLTRPARPTADFLRFEDPETGNPKTSRGVFMSMRPHTHRLSILALLLLALAACQSDEAKIAEHMARGDEYAEQKKQAEAIIEYKSVLQLDPNHAAAHYALAKAYL